MVLSKNGRVQREQTNILMLVARSTILIADGSWYRYGRRANVRRHPVSAAVFAFVTSYLFFSVKANTIQSFSGAHFLSLVVPESERDESSGGAPLPVKAFLSSIVCLRAVSLRFVRLHIWVES